ncbi:hypothetical protein [Streptomyces lavendofoliae]|uniref:hypothetical protein n=1 Tax=Streptomyces lavendofoliae TaxID=67314 RepID=UPI003D8F6D02
MFIAAVADRYAYATELAFAVARVDQGGVGAAVWRRLGCADQQTLTDVLDNPDGEYLCRRQVSPVPKRRNDAGPLSGRPGGRCAGGAGRS